MKKWFGLVVVLLTFYLSSAVAEGLVPVLDPALGSAAERISTGRVNGVSINDDLTVVIRTDGFGRVFGDGTGSTLQSPWGWINHEDLRFTHSYSSPGVYTVVDDVSCPSNASIYLAQASEEIGGQSSYTPPPSASVPAFDHEPLVNNGADFGETFIAYDDSSLVCSATGDGEFRLEGDISVTPSSYIRISNDLPSIGMCSRTSRTHDNISHTEAHELVHANALVGVINDHKAQIGTEYSSHSSCESTLSTLKTNLARDFPREVTRQGNHLDHAGQRRHAAVCPTPGGDTMEVVCGLEGYECQPGNFYPGP